jgi:cysteinyl-tRNA synthetase
VSLLITNSLTGEKEEFKSIIPNSVSIYFCGLTVSDLPHLGHARAWVHVDVMRRWLEHLGFSVTYVENFTDINEKIVARIGEVDYGESESEVATYFINKTLEDMSSLGLKSAHVYPKASEHIPEIINIISSLLNSNHAYESNGSVYFDVSSFDSYGELSKPNLDGEFFLDTSEEPSEKKHPYDFALWKAGQVSPESISKYRDPNLPPIDIPSGDVWDSPWGSGRPGWHIECSAMSMTHLSNNIDIHAGGQDLMFPHHENEKAQSEASTGGCFANFWVHIRLLETQGVKMSSSLKNYFSVSNSISEFGANSIKMFLISTSYLRHQTYSEAALHEAVERWGRLERTYLRTTNALRESLPDPTITDEPLRKSIESSVQNFQTALNDDFNTREALVAIFDIVNSLNQHLEKPEKHDHFALDLAIKTLDDLARDVLGFSFDLINSNELFSEELTSLMEAREVERSKGNYEKADEIRKELDLIGVVVEDTENGPTYRRK